MEIIELTERQKKEFKKRRRKEKIKKAVTILKAKLFRKGLPKDDTRTIQVHPDINGNLTEYYVSNPILQESVRYGSVTAIKEDYENKRFVYLGIVSSADNALGIIESNVSISELVANPYGNDKLFEMLKNAEEVRDYYYDKIGEYRGPDEGHISHFFKPTFILGTIVKQEDGKFYYNSQSSPDIEKMLEDERNRNKKEELLREESAVEYKLGKSAVVAKRDCWIDQNNGLEYAGINMDALFFKYKPGKPVKTKDGKYVYKGSIKFGEKRFISDSNNKSFEIVNPIEYKDVIIWTDGYSLLQYFMDKKFEGLKWSLGELFTTSRIELSKANKDNFIGGLRINENGICEFDKTVPATVRFAESMLEEEKEENNQKAKLYNLDEIR